jgi:hypothetical protein
LRETQCRTKMNHHQYQLRKFSDQLVLQTMSGGSIE